MSFFSFSPENFNFSKFKDAVETVSMFDEKKCVVLSNVFFEGKNSELLTDYFENNKTKENDKVFVVIKEDELPKKVGKEFEALLEKPTMVYESKKFNNSALKDWIDKEVATNKASISGTASSRLVSYCKDDLWRLSNEIAKLAAYDKKITEENVDLLVEKNIESDIFNAIECLAKKDKQKAVTIFYNQIASGKNVSYVISMIAFQFRNMLKIKDLLDKGVSGDLITKNTKLHPFVVKKTLPTLKMYSFLDLKKIYQKLLEADIKTKTSKIDPLVILDDLILSI